MRPFFGTLSHRDALGSSWLPKLLNLGPRRESYPYPDLIADPGLIREIQPALDGDREKALFPSEAFLRWLILHPEAMTWPERGHAVFGQDTQHWRERLMGRRDLTHLPHEQLEDAREADRKFAVRKAVEELDRFGAAGFRGQWWAFEGFTYVDFYIQTDHLRLYIEGKRTEGLSPSTDWYPQRNQLLRNLESARIDAGDAPFACLVIAEEPLSEPDPSIVERSLPHLDPAARSTLFRHYLGTISWREACLAVELDCADMPNSL